MTTNGLRLLSVRKMYPTSSMPQARTSRNCENDGLAGVPNKTASSSGGWEGCPLE